MNLSRRRFIYGLLAIPAAALAGRLLPDSPRAWIGRLEVVPNSVWAQAFWRGATVGKPIVMQSNPAKGGQLFLTSLWPFKAATIDKLEIYTQRFGYLGEVDLRYGALSMADRLVVKLGIEGWPTEASNKFLNTVLE